MNISQILIVGGGTAGWMSACLMAHRWQSKNVVISVVESAKIGTMGVGEGSTPFLRDFFNELNIPESTWMPKCDATYKCGIDFPDWCGQAGPSSYFHPFYSQADTRAAGEFFTSCQQRREGFDTATCPDDFFINAYLAKKGKTPLSINGQPSDIDYGYHFDAAKLGAFLADHAQHLGVQHIQDDVVSIQSNESGIDSLVTKCNGQLRADLFVDCSGLKGLLIQQALGEELIDYEPYLANNAAVAISCELEVTNNQQAIQTYTNSRALSHGWMWSIPLQSRIGNGYVYSDKYLSPADAELELRKELNNDDAKALHLSWEPGRIEQHWKQNCVAIGLSQGFLEPLEAPMLNLVQQTCDSFINAFEQGESEKIRSDFNESINLLIDGTRDYLQAHYILNTRDDSNYWIAVRENPRVSDVLHDIIEGWDAPGSFEQSLAQHANKLAYGKTSWYCLLAGMGRFKTAHENSLRLTARKHQRIQQHCELSAQSFYSQSELFALSQYKEAQYKKAQYKEAQ